MKSRKLLIAIIISLMIGLVLGTLFAQHRQADYVKKHFVSSNTPTIFVHGWSSSGLAELPLIDSAEQIHVAKRTMVIHVRNNGTLKIRGRLNARMRNPIIQVIFDNNRAGEFRNAQWLKTVMRTLHDSYGVTQYNAVGHSMGAYAWTYYNMLVGNNISYPRLNRAVLIAGPYDGIIDNHKSNQPLYPPLSRLWDDYPNENRLNDDGRPAILHPEYRLLMRLAHRFPKQAKVLNIYGDLDDGSDSDGVVTNVSALSLGYLLENRVAAYKTQKITGPDAQHSRLHAHNLEVNKALLNWIWQR
ncbi:hypothetical protein FC96_GL000020 [Secundilactobacillus kimchicus JCM 15530]|uniref:Cell surface hydrolase n=1 Tax=Secundilactobacillus kimchicus JCM 15530 TaxID=1302272 RepID=A0A0R1HZL4_9LACO|nr:alpha/beta hydrolase [Secundilactobacillus kimchicus]KRK49105.1 hypothetical protein FC96_GL000020 [Secundilactobacillus kimchicus JCM 15530]